MLEEQPLDLSVRVGEYTDLVDRCRDVDDEYASNSSEHEHDVLERTNSRLRVLINHNVTATSGLSSGEERERDDERSSDDSDDSSCSNDGKNSKIRTRPPGTKPYKKNLIRRYCEFFFLYV